MNDAFKNAGSPWQDWPLDREIVLSRLIDAPRERREWGIGFGAVEYGGQTLAKLALHVAKSRGNG
jgi:hypothetical protein